MSSTISGTPGSTLSSILASGALPSVGTSNNTTGDTPDLQVAGLASGMNWQTIVEELANAERAPETQWEQQQSTLNTENADYSTILTDLNTLQTDVQALQNTSLYQGSTVQSSSSSIATGTTTTGATLGTYAFDISQLATAGKITGKGNISTVLAPGGNTASVTIGTAGFTTPITAGTFTVNGQQVTVSTTESLQQVLSDIKTDTDNAVTATYDPTADQITLSSSSPITLGSAPHQQFPPGRRIVFERLGHGPGDHGAGPCPIKHQSR